MIYDGPTMLRRALLLPLSLASLVACASSPAQNPTAEPTVDTQPDTTAAPEPSDAAPKASAAPTATSAGNDDAREMSATECKVLAQKYGDVTRADESAKLSPKLTDAQRKTAAAAIDDYAAKIAEKWEGGCVRDLTGKMASEKALKCAMAAKTVAAFDTCINGPGQ